ncbi:MAG: hypothetical protein Q8900_12080 [Bacillota bacterium]|nr:hypothetical protein [Bacillota bacterium]
MPNVTIVRPDITQEEKESNLRNFADIIEKIYRVEFGLNVKVELTDKRR